MNNNKFNFGNLPAYVQEKIKDFLIANNFPAAKALYDQWVAQMSH